jgi:tight adherence protein B
MRQLTGWASLRRQRAVGRQLHLALGELAAHLRAGRTLAQAVADVADDMPQPIRGSLAGAAQAIALGTPPAVAVAALGGEDAALLGAAVAVQSRAGGDLASLLDDLADALVERESERRLADVATAQARTTARMVAWMPAAALGALWLIDRPAAMLLVQSPLGWCAIAASGALTLAGFLVIRRLADVAS